MIEGKLWKLIWPKMSFHDSRTTDASYQLKILYLSYLYSYEQKFFFGKTKPIDMAAALRKHGEGNGRRTKGSKKERSSGGDDSDDVDATEPSKKDKAEKRGGAGRGNKGADSEKAVRVQKNPLAYKRPFYVVCMT